MIVELSPVLSNASADILFMQNPKIAATSHTFPLATNEAVQVKLQPPCSYDHNKYVFELLGNIQPEAVTENVSRCFP